MPRLARGPAVLLLLVPAVVLIGMLAERQILQPVAPPNQRVRGVLLEVKAMSPVYAERITLRDDSGQVWTFQVDAEVATNREVPQSAGHLRQHMALVEPMLVQYRESSDGLVAVRITDAE